MARPPLPPHPSRPNLGHVTRSDPEGREAGAAWLAHVAAGRIGAKSETPEHIRAIHEANERLIRGRGPHSGG